MTTEAQAADKADFAARKSALREKRMKEGRVALLERTTITAPVELTPAEFSDRAHALATALQDADAMAVSHAGVRKKMREEAAAQAGIVAELREVVATGTEEREVEVDAMADFDRKVVEFVLPSGVVVKSRELTDADRQLILRRSAE